MIRKLMLALGILAVATAPVQAAMPAVSQPREHDFRGEHERFERGERFRFHEPRRFGFAVEPPQCYWEKAHWVKQVYRNEYGGFAYVPQYIPGQWICY